jgi:hypothetical protein
MKFLNNFLKIITTSEPFLIVISGVLIYTIQQLISQLWILPIKEFKKCIANIETLMNRWDFLFYYTEGKTGSLADSHGSMDERIKTFRKQLNDSATELIYSYNSLPTAEKLTFRIQGFNIKKVKTSLIILSVNIAKEGDWANGASKASKEINTIYKYLKISKSLKSEL